MSLDVAVPEPDSRRLGAMLIEKRWFEPFTLFRRVDGDHVIVARRQPAELELAVLIGPRREDVPRERPPQRRVGRKSDDGEIRNRVRFRSVCSSGRW